MRSLVEIKLDQGGSAYPDDLVWLQVPLRRYELKAIQRKALVDDKGVATLVREWIIEGL